MPPMMPYSCAVGMLARPAAFKKSSTVVNLWRMDRASFNFSRSSLMFVVCCVLCLLLCLLLLLDSQCVHEILDLSLDVRVCDL